MSTAPRDGGFGAQLSASRNFPDRKPPKIRQKNYSTVRNGIPSLEIWYRACYRKKEQVVESTYEPCLDSTLFPSFTRDLPVVFKLYRDYCKVLIDYYYSSDNRLFAQSKLIKTFLITSRKEAAHMNCIYHLVKAIF